MSQVACGLEITITQPWDHRLGFLLTENTLPVVLGVLVKEGLRGFPLGKSLHLFVMVPVVGQSLSFPAPGRFGHF